MASKLIFRMLKNQLPTEFNIKKSNHLENIDIYFQDKHIMNLFIDINVIEKEEENMIYLRHYNNSWKDVNHLVDYLQRKYILKEKNLPEDKIYDMEF